MTVLPVETVRKSPPKQNRSAEELAMRDAVIKWGRSRWPGTRMVHELVVTDCRIDMAFIGRDHLVGVEIKSSKDTLDRLEKQHRVFRQYLPECWLAIAPKWVDPLREGHFRSAWSYFDRIVVDIEKGAHVLETWGRSSHIDRSVTAPMLHLLWRAELLAIAGRMRLDHSPRSTMGHLVPTIARKLTGDEIVIEVCRELRGRNAFWGNSDPPVLT